MKKSIVNKFTNVFIDHILFQCFDIAIIACWHPIRFDAVNTQGDTQGAIAGEIAWFVVNLL